MTADLDIIAEQQRRLRFPAFDAHSLVVEALAECCAVDLEGARLP